MTVLQGEFRRAILDGARKAPEGLVDPAGRPAGRRFDVYRNNVVVSLTSALAEGFPATRRIVGEDFFAGMAGAFLRRNPPRSPLLMLYGADFPDFIAAFAPAAGLGYLADVARLEYAIRQSYHAADRPAIDPARLGALPAAALMASRLELAPCLRLVRSVWPVHAIWRFNMVEGAPKPAMQAEDVLICRPEFDPLQVLLPKGGGDFVSALMARQSLGEAAAAGEGIDLAQVLGTLVAGKAITALTLGGQK